MGENLKCVQWFCLKETLLYNLQLRRIAAKEVGHYYLSCYGYEHHTLPNYPSSGVAI